MVWLMAFLALAGLASPSASAHEMQPMIATLKPTTDGLHQIVLRGNFEAIVAGIGAEHDDTSDSPNAMLYKQLRALPKDQLDTRIKAMGPDLTAGITLTADTGRTADIAIQSIAVPPVGDQELARLSTVTLTAELPAGTQRATWQWKAAFGDSIIRVENTAGEVTYSAYMKPGDTSAAFAVTDGQKLSLLQVAKNYVVIGFEHILPKGLDHILFVLVLQRDFIPVGEVVVYVVFDATDKPHGSAGGDR